MIGHPILINWSISFIVFISNHRFWQKKKLQIELNVSTKTVKRTEFNKLNTIWVLVVEVNA
jgi:hypothetical protein